jgi:hypothetical protein
MAVLKLLSHVTSVSCLFFFLINFRVNIIKSEGNAQHLLHDLGVPSLILHFMSKEVCALYFWY